MSPSAVLLAIMVFNLILRDDDDSASDDSDDEYTVEIVCLTVTSDRS